MFATYLFKESSYRYAILAAILWHLFWLFVISVDITPQHSPPHSNSRIYFLGPVLSDEPLNLILETKPELSRTLYRVPEDAAQQLEPDVKQLGRKSPGDLVSVPLPQQTWPALQGALVTAKEQPRRVYYEKFPIRIAESPFPISGDLSQREIFQMPDIQDAQGRRLSLVAQQEFLGVAEFELEVNPKGEVVMVEKLLSSGDLQADAFWANYLKSWQFMPVDETYGENQTGRVRIQPEREITP